jgi:hypothetical protein
VVIPWFQFIVSIWKGRNLTNSADLVQIINARRIKGEKRRIHPTAISSQLLSYGEGDAHQKKISPHFTRVRAKCGLIGYPVLGLCYLTLSFAE